MIPTNSRVNLVSTYEARHSSSDHHHRDLRGREQVATLAKTMTRERGLCFVGETIKDLQGTDPLKSPLSVARLSVLIRRGRQALEATCRAL